MVFEGESSTVIIPPENVSVILTFEPIIIQVQAASAATAASERKSAKYSSLSSSHIFYPVAIETLGPLADETQHFLTEIGRRATRCTADPREAAFLYQRISVAIQRFNAVCLANSLTVSESPS